MNENNELNDIILNKNSSANSNKKIILAVATLGVILIIVVMLMNSLSSSGIDNLPKATLPPQLKTELTSESTQEPLFEDLEVEQEGDTTATNLEEVAQKLKEESISDNESEFDEPATVVTPEPKKAPIKQVAQQPVQKPVQKAPQQPVQKAVQKPVQQQATKVEIPPFPETIKKPTQKVQQPQATPGKAAGKGYYIQVGSFSKYAPNKNFLKSITDIGYNYEFLEANNINKVLVGPFTSEDDAKEARRVMRSKIEPGAFLIKL